MHALSLTNLLRSFLLIFALNLLKEVSFLSFILNFDHKNGPKNLRECFPYLTVFTPARVTFGRSDAVAKHQDSKLVG